MGYINWVIHPSVSVDDAIELDIRCTHKFVIITQFRMQNGRSFSVQHNVI